MSDAEKLGYHPLSRTSVSEMLLHHLEQAILNGQLQPGDRVTEAELCERFSLGRSTVREALAAAATLGLVVRRPEGTFVQPPSEWRHQELTYELCLLKASALEILETREILEVSIARLAAERATDEDIASLESTVVPEPTVEQFLELDEAFHVGLAEATHNVVLEQIYRDVAPIFFRRARFRQRLRTPENRSLDQELVNKAMAGHAAVLEAVRAHDADKAGDLMKRHLDVVREGLQQMK